MGFGSAADPAHQLTRLAGSAREQLAHLTEAIPELSITHLDRQHRILHPGDDRVGPLDGGDRTLQVGAGVARGDSGSRRRQGIDAQPVSLGESHPRSLGPPIGGLDGTKQLRLELIAGLLVGRLVGLADSVDGQRKLPDGLSQLIQKLPAG